MTKKYDLVVLGGGIGGYVAAIRAAQLGMTVAIVERNKLGGTCLHEGCIGSKALLRSAEIYSLAKNMADFGVDVENISLNYQKAHERKGKVIKQLYQGIQYLMEKNNIDVYNGFGRILGPSIFSPIPGTISIEHENGEENTMISPKNVIIATGSKPRHIQGIDVDGTYILTSTEALEMTELPKSIMIVGGGVIGVEFASMLADFDVEVTLIETHSTVLHHEDESISKEMMRLFKRKKVKVVKNAKIIPETLNKREHVSIEVEIDGVRKTLQADKMLICIGRTENVENIGLNNTEIKVVNGAIETNEFYQTNESHIYAIGDVIGGSKLAHVAAKEGIVAVEHIAGLNPMPVRYDQIPSCIFSNPEIASVGLTEKQAREKGYDIKMGQFPFKANGKSLIYGNQNGFVKVIADKNTNDLLGVHMIGPHVSDMISEAGLAQVLDATPWEMTMHVHPHPTLSEVLFEAALAVDDKQIHG